MGSSKREVELEEQLKDAGNLLLNPPSSVDEVINLLDVKIPPFVFILYYIFMCLFLIFLCFEFDCLLFGQMVCCCLLINFL